MAYRIYLSPPYMGGREERFVKEAFDTNWIAPYGPHLPAFEQETAGYIGVGAALAVSSGTAAIHLALRRMGVGQGDYVFCQDFTFIGSCDAILYEKAAPVFIDSEPGSWNMSPAALEKAFRWAKENGKMPKAVIVVDLYGESADWDALLPICRKYGVPVLEDAAEALGASYKGKKCGAFGDIGVLSFNGNKIVTTSGGGMVLSNDAAAIEKMRFWSTQAREPVIWYEHKDFGYNYRLSNVSAAIGRGQMLCLEEKLSRRLLNHRRYQQALSGLPCHIKEPQVPGATNYWLNLMVMDKGGVTPGDVVSALQKAGIETRPAWKPMHMQPLFQDAPFVTDSRVYPRGGESVGSAGVVGEAIFASAVCLPSGDALTDAQIEEIAGEIRALFQ